MTDTPVSMIATMPTPGQDPWGEDLNAYLTGLESRVTTLESRVTALEAKPEYLFNSTSWQFSNAAPPATGNQVRLNNTAGNLATLIDIRNIDNDGADRSSWFALLDVGSFVRIQDWNVSANYYRYHVTGPTTIGATNTTIPVTWDKGGGVVPNAKCNIGFIVAVTDI